VATRRSHGDGGLHWDETRQRWIATITTGYTPTGKRVVRRASGRTKTEARAKLKDLIRDHDDGMASAERGYTVAQAVTDWLDYGLPGRNHITVDTKRILATQHVIPALGARKLVELSADEVDQWLVEKATSLSTRTVADLKSILRRAITRAQSRDKVRRNVVLLCGTPTGQSGRPSKALTLEQAQALVEHAGGSTMGTYVLMSLLTGARTEELRALTWSHLDLNGQPGADPPVPPHAMVWRSVRTGGDTKTRKSRRTVALPARCVDALLEHRDRQATSRHAAGERWIDNDLVFASAVGSPLDAANVRRGFRRVAAAAGLDAADWTPRELRHSFVSVLSDAGVPIEQIARLVGHTGGSTVTETVYRKQLRPVIEDGATVMDRVFGRGTAQAARRTTTPQQPQRGGPSLH
jgi:integrase